jgi:hypothetical protein
VSHYYDIIYINGAQDTYYIRTHIISESRYNMLTVHGAHSCSYKLEDLRACGLVGSGTQGSVSLRTRGSGLVELALELCRLKGSRTRRTG